MPLWQEVSPRQFHINSCLTHKSSNRVRNWHETPTKCWEIILTEAEILTKTHLLTPIISQNSFSSTTRANNAWRVWFLKHYFHHLRFGGVNFSSKTPLLGYPPHQICPQGEIQTKLQIPSMTQFLNMSQQTLNIFLILVQSSLI